MSARVYGPTPSVSIEQALGSDLARRERDLQLARWCGLSDDEVGPLLRRLAEFDARTPAWEARCALADALDLAERRRAVLERVEQWEDTREGMLVRVDAVIADLVDQLGDALDRRAA